MEIVNVRINELFLFKSKSENQYVNNMKLSKKNLIKLIKKWILILNSIDSSLGFSTIQPRV